jgi:hypothetical protein
MDNVLDRVRRAGLRIADPGDSRRHSLLILSAIILAIGVLLFLARLFLFIPTDPNKPLILLIITQNVSDNLIATCIAVIIGSLTLSILADPVFDLEDISAIPAHKIHSSLIEPLPTTTNYWFRGRSGRFFRQRVLPALADAGAQSSSRRYVHLLLPDPDKQSMLEQYANYRNSLHFEKQGKWTARRVQIEVIATILAALEQSAQSQFFVPAIAVGQDFALFRIDMSDERMVMTREDPAWPGIICTHKSKFYSSYQEEIRQGMALGRALDLSRFPKNTCVADTNVASVISELGFSIPIDEEFVKEVIAAIRHPKNPYG